MPLRHNVRDAAWEDHPSSDCRSDAGGEPIPTQIAITLSDIQNVVDQIVDRFHPDKIWLFGSFAHGTPTSDSDVDLLVRTPGQIAERLALGDGFFRDVLTKGIVLYEATDA